MKIERNDSPTILRFDEIAEGDVFLDTEGEVCMKMQIIVEEDGYHTYNAINLDSGEACFYEPFERISLPHSAKLIID
jgi:hypothetical protein